MTIGILAAGLIAAWGMLGVMRDLRWLLEAAVVALFLSFAGDAPVDRLEEKGMRRSVAAGVVLLSILALFVGTAWVLAPAIARAGGTVYNHLDQLTESAGALADSLGISAETVKEAVSGAVEGVTEWLGGAGGGAIVGAIGSAMLQLITTVFLLYYCLVEGDKFRAGLLRLVKGEERRRVLARTWDLALVKTSGFIGGNLILAVIAGVFVAGVAVLLGLPTPLGLGAWVLVSSLLPLIGGWVAGVLPALVAVTVDLVEDGFTNTIVMLAALFLFQAVDNYWLRPRIMSKTVDIPPVLAFLAVVGGASIGGLIGAILSIPVAAICWTWGQEWMAAQPELAPGIAVKGQTRGAVKGLLNRRQAGLSNVAATAESLAQATPGNVAETLSAPEAEEKTEEAGGELMQAVENLFGLENGSLAELRDQPARAAVVAAIAEQLEHNLIPERIREAVRHPVDAWEGRSLLDMIEAGEEGVVLDKVEASFDYTTW